MKDFRNLKVRRVGHELTVDVYRLTAGFPRHELYGLTSQIRRSSASIPANIAEGCGREGDPELCRFLIIARGSASELEYHLLLAQDLTFLSPERNAPLTNKVIEIKRMLTALIKRLKADR